MRLRLLLIGFILATGTAAWYWLTLLPVDVDAVRPQIGSAVEAVYASGVVETEVDARVGAVGSGRIMDVVVREGDAVEKGALLAVMDDRQALSQLAETKARLVLAEAEEARIAELVRRGVSSQQALQRAAAETRMAAALVDVAARVAADRRILSPLTGFVMNRLVEPGESVAANTPLFVVAASTPLIVAADVDERDVPRVRVGAEVALGAEAFPGETFVTKVAKIRPLGDATTRTYRVEAGLPADTRLLPGMTVDVNILLARHEGVLLVPARSVARERSRGGAPGAAFVWLILPNGGLERRAVKIGVDGPHMVEIREGIDAEALIAANPAAIPSQSGRPVRPRTP